jgi:hypothetical protein
MQFSGRDKNMKKHIRLSSIGIVFILVIPVFRYLCEKFRKCEAMRAYTIFSESEALFIGLV